MRKRRLISTALGVIVVLILAWIRISDPFPVAALRDVAFDGFQRAAPRESGNFPVRIVDIDEASLAAIGQWPWPRDMMAMLANRLTELGAAAVVYDILFAEPDRSSPSRIMERFATAVPDEGVGAPAAAALPDFDRDFAAALARSPSVLGVGDTTVAGDPVIVPPKAGFALVGASPLLAVPAITRAAVPLPMLAEAARGLGSIGLEPGGNVSTIRRVPLLWSNGSSLMPSLALEALRVALGTSTVVVFSDQAGVIASIRVGDFEIPTTPSGALWLHYQPTPPDLYLSAKDILGDAWADQRRLIEGNIVFIGTSATGLLDIRGTPLGVNMPGVEIHVQAIQQILSGSYLQRSDWVSGLEILAFIAIGLIIVLVILASGPLLCLIVGGVLVSALAAASWFGFTRFGILIDPSFPIIGSSVVYASMIFAQFVLADSDRRKIRGAFGHYVAPAVLSEIERNSERLKLGGEMRELTILFTDMRSFTAISEGLDPVQLVKLLNTLFGALGTCITEEFGTIDKFIGDAVMAFWNAPVDVDRHASRACLAALAMRKALAALNAADAFGLKAGEHPIGEINIGIGIATGEALVGNLGLETHFNYSCVGDVVNTTSRLESSCKAVGYDIIVSEPTRAATPDLAFLEAGSIPLKGKSKREPIHILVGDAGFARSETFQRLSAAHGTAIAALRLGHGADEAIDACLELVTSPDDRLTGFYQAMRRRAEDYATAVAAAA